MMRRILHILVLLAMIAGQALPVSAARMLCGMDAPVAATAVTSPTPAIQSDPDATEPEASCDRCGALSAVALPANAPVLESRTCCLFEATPAPETAPSIMPSLRRAACDEGSDIQVLAPTPTAAVVPVFVPTPFPDVAPLRFDPLQSHRTTVLRR